MILHQLERVNLCRSLQKVVLATSTDSSDDELAEIVEYAGFTVFRGDLDDVLSRFQACGKDHKGSVLVRLTGDCPLSDPAVIDEVVDAFHKESWDYLSNSTDDQALSVPDGFDVEVFHSALLEQAAACATLPSEREHVTPWMRRPELSIKAGHYIHQTPTPFYRLTVDDPQDFAMVSQVFNALYPINIKFDLNDVVVFLQQHPDLAASNMATNRNEGFLRSLSADPLASSG